jgi:hypothetical protein
MVFAPLNALLAFSMAIYANLCHTFLFPIARLFRSCAAKAVFVPVEQGYCVAV